MRRNLSHEHNIEHNRSKIRALYPGTMVKNQGMHNSLDYANLVIKINKIVYELWHNCSSYGHNVEHNRQLFRAMLKSIIDEKLTIIGQGVAFGNFPKILPISWVCSSCFPLAYIMLQYE